MAQNQPKFSSGSGDIYTCIYIGDNRHFFTRFTGERKNHLCRHHNIFFPPPDKVIKYAP